MVTKVVFKKSGTERTGTIDSEGTVRDTSGRIVIDPKTGKPTTDFETVKQSISIGVKKDSGVVTVAKLGEEEITSTGRVLSRAGISREQAAELQRVGRTGGRVSADITKKPDSTSIIITTQETIKPAPSFVAFGVTESRRRRREEREAQEALMSSDTGGVSRLPTEFEMAGMTESTAPITTPKTIVIKPVLFTTEAQRTAREETISTTPNFITKTESAEPVIVGTAISLGANQFIVSEKSLITKKEELIESVRSKFERELTGVKKPSKKEEVFPASIIVSKFTEPETRPPKSLRAVDKPKTKASGTFFEVGPALVTFGETLTTKSSREASIDRPFITKIGTQIAATGGLVAGEASQFIGSSITGIEEEADVLTDPKAGFLEKSIAGGLFAIEFIPPVSRTVKTAIKEFKILKKVTKVSKPITKTFGKISKIRGPAELALGAAFAITAAEQISAAPIGAKTEAIGSLTGSAAVFVGIGAVGRGAGIATSELAADLLTPRPKVIKVDLGEGLIIPTTKEIAKISKEVSKVIAGLEKPGVEFEVLFKVKDIEGGKGFGVLAGSTKKVGRFEVVKLKLDKSRIIPAKELPIIDLAQIDIIRRTKTTIGLSGEVPGIVPKNFPIGISSKIKKTIFVEKDSFSEFFGSSGGAIRKGIEPSAKRPFLSLTKVDLKITGIKTSAERGIVIPGQPIPKARSKPKPGTIFAFNRITGFGERKALPRTFEESFTLESGAKVSRVTLFGKEPFTIERITPPKGKGRVEFLETLKAKKEPGKVKKLSPKEELFGTTGGEGGEQILLLKEPKTKTKTKVKTETITETLTSSKAETESLLGTKKSKTKVKEKVLLIEDVFVKVTPSTKAKTFSEKTAVPGTSTITELFSRRKKKTTTIFDETIIPSAAILSELASGTSAKSFVKGVGAQETRAETILATKTGVKSATSQRTGTKTLAATATVTILDLKSSLKSLSAVKTGTITATLSKSKTDTIAGTLLKSDTATKTKQKTGQKTRTKTITEQLTKTDLLIRDAFDTTDTTTTSSRFKLTVPKLKPPKLKPPKPPRLPPTPGFEKVKRRRAIERSFASKAKSLQAFAAFIKKKGKFELVKTGVTRAAALDIGAAEAKRTLAATFRIRAVGGKAVKNGDTGTFRKFRSEFRSFKKVKGKRIELEDEFIQKRGARLGTKTERRSIQKARANVRFIT